MAAGKRVNEFNHIARNREEVAAVAPAVNGRMLARVGWHLHHHSGQKPCGECGSGWPHGR